MKKKITLSEAQLRRVVSMVINEAVESTNPVNNVNAKWTKLSYGFGISEHLLDGIVNGISIELIGTTDEEPLYIPGRRATYSQPPEDPEVRWYPKVFYPKDVYIIENDISVDECGKLVNLVLTTFKNGIQLGKEVEIDADDSKSKYRISDADDSYEDDAYDDYRDDKYFG